MDILSDLFGKEWSKDMSPVSSSDSDSFENVS